VWGHGARQIFVCSVVDEFFGNNSLRHSFSNVPLELPPLNRPFRFAMWSYFDVVFDAIEHRDLSLTCDSSLRQGTWMAGGIMKLSGAIRRDANGRKLMASSPLVASSPRSDVRSRHLSQLLVVVTTSVARTN